MEQTPQSRSSVFRTVVIIIGVLLIVIASFAIGVATGIHKTRFSSEWGRQYERNFVGDGDDDRLHMGGMMGLRSFEGREYRNANGVAGEILSLNDQKKIVIKDRDGKENTVQIVESTVLRKQREAISWSDLKAGDRVVVLGKPTQDGVIEAELLRVFVEDSWFPGMMGR